MIKKSILTMVLVTTLFLGCLGFASNPLSQTNKPVIATVVNVEQTESGKSILFECDQEDTTYYDIDSFLEVEQNDTFPMQLIPQVNQENTVIHYYLNFIPIDSPVFATAKITNVEDKEGTKLVTFTCTDYHFSHTFVNPSIHIDTDILYLMRLKPIVNDTGHLITYELEFYEKKIVAGKNQLVERPADFLLYFFFFT